MKKAVGKNPLVSPCPLHASCSEGLCSCLKRAKEWWRWKWPLGVARHLSGGVPRLTAPHCVSPTWQVLLLCEQGSLTAALNWFRSPSVGIKASSFSIPAFLPVGKRIPDIPVKTLGLIGENDAYVTRHVPAHLGNKTSWWSLACRKGVGGIQHHIALQSQHNKCIRSLYWRRALW